MGELKKRVTRRWGVWVEVLINYEQGEGMGWFMVSEATPLSSPSPSDGSFFGE